MPPAKSKANPDDAKSDTASLKERNGHGPKDIHKPNGKLQRVASSTGSQLKEAMSVKGSATTTIVPVPQPITPGSLPPQLQWSTFDRDVLHEYRREHRLDTPTAFSSSYRYWVLSQSHVGLRSPTMARRSQFRRQSKDDLTKAVRRHFNGVGVQENDVIVDFLHKVRNPGVVKPRRNKEAPHSSPLP
ncbi:hypothetical protein E0Z10_g8721 [Xylaria hypoxylon]|uniref:Histone deacetylase complex subunit SAP30 Sin3 binding domain-containing protein n=1 Tax=Xylaria hypoxylon TaxID=37992 RepID=A0A4Z0YN09_9PEZI|nr:hypothetical protein E0Z10_g8721 [Xylaria hypoxylon]